MRKFKALLAVLCIVFASCAFIACDIKDNEPSKTAVDAPVINSKVYNGEKQTATIEANDAYVVIENNGGVNAGEYNVVLKLTDENAYEWKTPDEADATTLTLKFVIAKATNSVSDLTLVGWSADETANIPKANAKFGEVKFAYATEQNGTYTEIVPTAAGTYFVKAYVEATENYDGAEAVISFVITKAKKENAVTVTAEDIKYGENVTPVVNADATHVPEGKEIIYTYALTSDGEYVAWDVIEKRAGTYFVKATIAEDDDYKGAFGFAEFEMLKGDNFVNDFEIGETTCRQAPVLSATATAGTAVTYKYATAENGEYKDIPADGLVAGTYYVKAYTAGDNNHVAAESKPATLTVKHAYFWKTDEQGNDYRACACGADEKFVIVPESDVFEKTESGYALKLYGEKEEGKPDKVTFSFRVTLGTNVTDNAVMVWEQSTEGIVEITGSAEYTIKALASGETVLTATFTDGNGKKAHITINVTVERIIKAIKIEHEAIVLEETATEIDLSFAREYIGDYVSLTYNRKFLGVGPLKSGKLTVDLSGITERGELVFVAVTGKGNVTYFFNVNVLLATKIIRTAEDMSAVRITAEQLQGYTPIEGYYVLGNDIDFGGVQLNSDIEKVIYAIKGNYYWDQNQGFRGTFDGRNHKITNVKVGQGGIFGYVGENALIKNVDFEDISYIGDYCGSLLGYSVINATVQNVNITVSAYTNGAKNPETQGFLSGKFTAGCKFINVKIDAEACDVSSLFGREVKSGTYTDVEIKVKSYVMFANAGDGINKEDKTIVPEGITVYTTETVEVKHETVILEETATEIDLSFANEYIGDTVSLSYNGAVLGDGALSGGKLTVDLSGITERGELVFVAVTKKGTVTYCFEVNVLLATKIIRTAEDLNAIKITQSNVDNNSSIYGYYVLGNDIDLGWNTALGSTLKYEGTVKIWEDKFGFRGTFDGRGHTISKFCVNANGMFGHVGKDAVIKNVRFSELKYNGHEKGALFGGTVRGATIVDITISDVEYVNYNGWNPYAQGFFGGRYLQESTLKNIKIDASTCDVYSLFGDEVSKNKYSDVEIKVKSYTMFAYRGSDVDGSDKTKVPDGVTVITADTTTEA